MKVNKIIVTNINFGYIPLLENLRNNLQTRGLLKYLHIYAVGQRCKVRLDELGISSVLIEDKLVKDDAINWAAADWKRISYQKITTLKAALSQFDGFLYTDPDIYFQKDVFSYLETLSGLYDIYGQNDYPNHIICSGFMYIQNNERTKKAFSVSWEEYDRITNIGDQVYINKRRDLLKLYSLPQDLFLNGIWFDPTKARFKADEEILKNAYIFHYNYTASLKVKYQRMRLNNHLSKLPIIESSPKGNFWTKKFNLFRKLKEL